MSPSCEPQHPSSCSAEGCSGSLLGADELCFAHTADNRWKQIHIRDLRDGGSLSFIEGSLLNEATLSRILASLPRRNGYLVIRDANFRGVTFEDTARFFLAEGNLRVMFEGDADFTNAIFHHGARLFGARFEGKGSFGNAVFHEGAGFANTEFMGSADFRLAQFPRGLSFANARFHGDLKLVGVKFGVVDRLGPLVVLGHLFLNLSEFNQYVEIDVSATSVSLYKTAFPEGVWVRARWAELFLDEGEFPRSCTVSERPNEIDALEHRIGQAALGRTFTPRVASVRGANVTGLVLDGLDLSSCRFASTRYLECLRIEGRSSFAQPPTGWHIGKAWPPIWRWTARQTLAEEQELRGAASNPKRGGWNSAECGAPEIPQALLNPGELKMPAPDPFRQLEAPEVAGLYRALRRGREDNKDEPGAADFYYGEMEMRRKASTKESRETGARLAPGGERLILSFYWLTSGYGLRASRAILGLAISVGIFGVLFQLVGFAGSVDPFVGPPPAQVASSGHAASVGMPPPSPSLGRAVEALGSGKAWTYSALTATAIFTPPAGTLTLWGQSFRLLLRLLGPVFLGLIVLSVRGRIRR